MFEIEIKALLEEISPVDFKENLFRIFPEVTFIGQNSQLNHYFTGSSSLVFSTFSRHLNAKQTALLEKVLTGDKISVRTRELNQTKTFLVIKSALKGSDSINGDVRLEFEEEVPFTIKDLDKLLVSIGFEEQAKWSRYQEVFKVQDITLNLNKNAGYGYLVELEICTEQESDVTSKLNTLREVLDKLGLRELPKDRLARMFDFYNNNWQKYYGTENVFEVK